MSERAHAAGLLAVGDELLAGSHPDLNSPYAAHRLVEVGWPARRIVTVGDDEEPIAEAIRGLAAEARLVVASGGLGPTLDDVTRHGAARAAGRALVHSEEAWSRITAWFERAGREMPASNRRQALIPEGAEVLENRRGTAPGFRVPVGESTLIVLPGPPREFQPMVGEHVLPWLAARGRPGIVHRARRFYLVDLSESAFADGVGDWMQREANPLMGVTADAGVLSVRLIARGATEAEADELLAVRGGELLERFGGHVFSEDKSDVAFALGELLLARGATVTVAESCTGGAVAFELTRFPGISAVFHESQVVYSDRAKVERLGVDPELLARHGAVSAEVAAAMARGAAERTGAELALSVTGIAGPGGGTPGKPVGTVWFGLSRRGEVTTVLRRWPDAGRDAVRRWATTKALALLLEAARLPR